MDTEPHEHQASIRTERHVEHRFRHYFRGQLLVRTDDPAGYARLPNDGLCGSWPHHFRIRANRQTEIASRSTDRSCSLEPAAPI